MYRTMIVAAVLTMGVASPADAAFPFQKGDKVSIIGNALADRMQHDGWMETVLQSALPDKNLVFRNMGFSGDQAAESARPRNKGFTTPSEYLKHTRTDVLFVMFGYNESFAGAEGLAHFRDHTLKPMVENYKALKPNGKSEPRIVLFTPIAHEDLNSPNLPDGSENNRRLAMYSQAIEQVARETGSYFVDLFTTSKALYAKSDEPLTINGVHLNTEGNRQIAEVIAQALLGKKVKASKDLEPIREAVVDKNWHWFNRYRATDGNDIWGGRSTLTFVNDQTNAEVLQHELAQLDLMTANRDPKVWARANHTDHTIDDSNVPPAIKVISNVGGGSKSSNAMKEGSLNYVSGQEGLKHMTLKPGLQANLFADEERFPELVNPVQMQVDGKGRLWVAAWPTYPKWEPGKVMNDKLLILEDTDKDGVADKCKTFAEVHNPLGFEFWGGGVLVTSQPEIIFLKDTDGDDVADVRVVMVQGLGSADTHHAANNLIMGPDGAIYYQSGIFLANNIETPWGPSLNTGASAMYRFDPRRFTLNFHAPNRPNPHGTSFDYWGYHYANDGTGGKAYQVVPTKDGFDMVKLLEKEVRPVPANEIVSSAHFPEDMQGNFLICNTIGYLGIKEYKLDRNPETGRVWGEPESDMLVSSDKNFRPTDAVFGADGALYVADWHNVIIGHMQHNIRDPNRDHRHGRVYRITAKNRPLQKPVAIAGQPIAKLLDNLKHPVDGVRHRTRIELSGRDSGEVIAACQSWMK
ncbi:MAG: PVC-type heme-binding CxxCH protein, partial [Planctomycetota bacterium]